MVSKSAELSARYAATFDKAEALTLQVMLKQHPDTTVNGRGRLSLHGVEYPAGTDSALCYDCFVAGRTATYVVPGDPCSLWAESETALVRVYGITCRENHGSGATAPRPVPPAEPEPRMSDKHGVMVPSPLGAEAAPEPPKAGGHEHDGHAHVSVLYAEGDMSMDEFVELAKKHGAKRIAVVWL